MLELAILGLLKERPMHGYDLRKQLRGGFGLLASLSFGSLYPALGRLERAGAVREIDPETPPAAEVIPLTGSLAGEKAAWRARLAARAAGTARGAGRSSGTRGRKVYELTPVGEETFSRLLAAEGGRNDDDRLFALRWSFARHLSSEGRVRLLERQRRRLDERLAAARRGLDGAAGLDVYERQIADHTVENLAAELAFVESLLALEHESSGTNAQTDAS